MDPEPAFDLLIINGRAIDPLKRLDAEATIGIKEGKVALLEKTDRAKAAQWKAAKVIDAAGLVVAPGFINVHGHEGIIEETMRASVLDGVTTIVGGQCGYSPGFPEEEKRVGDFYLDVERMGLFNNFCAMAGHNTLRQWSGVAGAGEAASGTQVMKMRDLLSQELESGALGISFGPGFHLGASYGEMKSLAEQVYQAGGAASIHIRYPIPPLNFDAFKEALQLAEETGIPLVISHITGSSYGGTGGDTGQALELMAKALQNGLPVATDSTVWDANITAITVPILDSAPAEVLLQVVDADISDFRVLRSVNIGNQLCMNALERFSSIEQFTLVREKVKSGQVPEPGLIGHIFKPHKQWLALSVPFVMVENDAWVMKDEVTKEYGAHPRICGTYSKFLGYWVRDLGLTDLISGLYKTSTAAALFFSLPGKGSLQVGFDADLVLFDPQKIMNTSSFAAGEWFRAPEGISHVIVNGEVVVEEGKHTGKRPGKVIRRNWNVKGEIPGPWKVFPRVF